MQAQFELEIETEDGSVQNLQVYKELASKQLAQNFVEAYGLSTSMIEPLERYITEQRRLFNAKKHSQESDQELYTQIFNKSISKVSASLIEEEQRKHRPVRTPTLKEQMESVNRLASIGKAAHHDAAGCRGRAFNVFRDGRRRAVQAQMRNNAPDAPVVSQNYAGRALTNPQSGGRWLNQQDVFTRMFNYSKVQQQKRAQLVEDYMQAHMARTKKITNNEEVYLRNKEYQIKVGKKIELMRLEKAQKEQQEYEEEFARECTFKPQISRLGRQTLHRDELHKRVKQDAEAHKYRVDEIKEEVDKECTFKPNLRQSRIDQKVRQKLLYTTGSAYDRLMTTYSERRNYTTAVQKSQTGRIVIQE